MVLGLLTEMRIAPTLDTKKVDFKFGDLRIVDIDINDKYLVE